MAKENIIGDKKPLSISDYINLVNEGLKEFTARIIGEVGEVRIPSSGHVYFSLKDKKGESVIWCAIWKSRYSIYGVELKEGIKIIAFGCPNIHPPSGKFSFIAETIELAGEGELKKEYERLKKKMTEEGLFAEERKRPVPKYLQKIGVVTSRQGAVLADFLNNLGKFGFKIKMVDSRVEGQGAVKDLLSSINSFKKQDVEALVIMRGGGSLESLIAFNNEKLVREIVDFPVPVIAAIGHEKDAPLLSLAADVAASTPTVAANLLSESWEQAKFELERYEKHIIDSYNENLFRTERLLRDFIDEVKDGFSSILDQYREAENILKGFYSKIRQELALKRKDLINCSKSILKDFFSSIKKGRDKIRDIEKIIVFNNPERQFRLGYSIAKCKDKLIKSIRNVKIKDDIDLQVSDGIIQSTVKDIRDKK